MTHSDWKHDNLTEWGSVRLRSKYFDIFFLRQVPFIDRGQNFARIYGTISLKRGRLSAAIALFT